MSGASITFVAHLIIYVMLLLLLLFSFIRSVKSVTWYENIVENAKDISSTHRAEAKFDAISAVHVCMCAIRAEENNKGENSGFAIVM